MAMPMIRTPEPSHSLPSRADVVVVGGGAIGLAVAESLSRRGRDVLLLERGAPGGETTWGNCGLITPSYADPLTQPSSLTTAFSSLFDPVAPLRIAPTLSPQRLSWFLRFARNCREDHRQRARRARHSLLQSSHTLLDELVDREGLACGWVPGGLTAVFLTEEAFYKRLALHQRLAEELELPLEVLSGDEARQREPLLAKGVVGALRSPGDGHLDPRVLGESLAAALERRGVAVARGVAVERLEATSGRVDAVVTSIGRIAPGQVVLAAGPWSPLVARSLGLRLPMEPAKGYSITWSTPLPELQGPLKMYERMVVATPWSNGFRLGSTIEFAGWDPRPARHRLQRLIDGARLYLDHPLELGPGEEWFGYRPMCVDEVPLIGPSSRYANLSFACGHGQLGVSQCTATGELVAELLDGATPHIDPQPFSPARFGV